MNQKLFFKSACLFTYSALVPFAATAQANNDNNNKKPNIVFLFSDDNALNAISAYNDNHGTTHNIDRIAE